MKKSLFTVALIGVLTTIFTGCGGGSPSVSASTFKPDKDSIILMGEEQGYGRLGVYSVKSHYYKREGLLNYQIITNIQTNEQINTKNIKTNNEADLLPKVIGTANDKIYYAYMKGTFSQEHFLEVLDTKTNKVSTLVTGSTFGTNTKFQLLKFKNQVVIKIFDNKELKQEKIVWDLRRSKPTAESFSSKYANESAKYISLNSLKEVNGVSNNFRPVILYSKYTNAGNKQSKVAFITYSISELHSAMTKSIKSRKLKPLF